MRIIDIEWWWNMRMDCAQGGENRKGGTGNGGRTRNGQNREWQTTIAALISSRDLTTDAKPTYR
jgi:hypothetical protein